MTFTKYVASVDPYLKLKQLATRADPRKLRLFACACVREVGIFLKEDGSRRAVLVAERFADGQASDEERLAALFEAESARARVYAATRSDWRDAWRMRNAACAAKILLHPQAQRAALDTPQAIREKGKHVDAVAWNDSASNAHERFLRDLFDGPRTPRRIDPAWFRWNGAAVAKIARDIYEENCFEELPILADALEDAGCADEDILAHCREPGGHVRGCWVIDLLLGKG
jgi:hypothetical protein